MKALALIAGPFDVLNRPMAGFVDGLRRWLAYRDTVTALSKLSRRELADIGVDESIDSYAWRVANDEPRR